MVCGVLGAFTLGLGLPKLLEIYKQTSAAVMPVLLTMGSLLIVAYIMQSPSTGMIQLLAHHLADVAGVFYPAAAVAIGAGGAFVTGTGLGSNIMFADMHIHAAQTLNANPITIFAGQNAGASLGNMICPNNTVAGLGSNIMFADMHIHAAQTLNANPITIFAGQNAGASLGNMICPNNTVAACATVGQVNNEHKVMKETVLVFSIILGLYMTLAMLYTYVLFPNFGLN